MSPRNSCRPDPLQPILPSSIQTMASQVSIQLLDNLRSTFYQPRRPLLFGQAKDRVVELFA
jgi:hypothetical protein